MVRVLSKLEDAQALAVQYPDTFEAPTPADLDGLAPGDCIKVCREYERFWILITAIEANYIIGTIDNHLQEPGNRALTYGRLVKVERRHVYNTDTAADAAVRERVGALLMRRQLERDWRRLGSTAEAPGSQGH